MTPEELKELALAIAQESLERTEYSDVYEDEDLEDLTEEEMQKLHRLVITAQIVALTWEGK